MNITYKKYAAGVAVAAAVTILSVAVPAFAQSNGQGQNDQGNNGNHYGWMRPNNPHNPGPGMATSTRPTNWMPDMMNGQRPDIFGTVTAINGTTITVGVRVPTKPTTPPTKPQTPPSFSTTTYTVDASNATIYKNNATSSLSSIMINDRIMVMGTVSSTSVTAKTIRDGIPMMMRGRGPNGSENSGTGQSLPFKGNGEPVVAGTVSSINGNSIAITTSSNTSYTVDATSATVKKDNATSTVSAIALNDYVIVQGAINGSNVTASTIIDGQSHQNPGNTSGPGMGGPKGDSGSFFGAIGGFFKKIFGF